LANIVVIVSLSAALYAVARSQLGIEIRGAVDRTFETPRQVVDAKITGYQRLLDDDYKRLLEVGEKLLQLRVDLATMSQDVRGKLNSAESTVDKLTTDLDTERLSLFQQIEGKKSGLDLLDRELKEVLVKQKR
jgi:predicted  nucleic acid-binding Zn-ribbon protein